MRIFALSDPHLSRGVLGKEQDLFGDHWRRHDEKIGVAWRETVGKDDLVLVAGDLSWAMRLEAARPDLEFIGGLPGRKVICRGNHDYWWSSLNKVRNALPASMQAVQADAIRVGPVVIAGTRLWDVPGVAFAGLIDWDSSRDNKAEGTVGKASDPAQDLKIYQRELQRLKLALQTMRRLEGQGHTSLRIVMLHYPPCNASLQENEVTTLLETSGVDHVVFGHLHGVKRPLPNPLFGCRRGVAYHLTSCDFLDFRPIQLAEIPDKSVGH